MPPHHHHHHGQHHRHGLHHAQLENASSLLIEGVEPAQAASTTITTRAGRSGSLYGTLQQTPTSRLAELALLGVAMLLCVVMWCAARRRRPVASCSAADSGEGDGESTGDEPPRSPTPREEEVYRRLRNRYLGVYALATFGDWIQGGYLYALYADYGYSMRQIGLIFVVGYMSAATLGTYVRCAMRQPPFFAPLAPHQLSFNC
jgi:hypothetical protein